jgi:hypothetical protein
MHECRNWERGRAVSFLGIHKSDFRYSEDGEGEGKVGGKAWWTEREIDIGQEVQGKGGG